MTTNHHQRPRQALADRTGQSQGSKSFGGEVALDADDRGLEACGLGQPPLDPVDAQIHKLTGVTGRLERAGDALEAERLDEGDHLQADDAAVGRLEQRHLHDWNLYLRARSQQIRARLSTVGRGYPKGWRCGLPLGWRSAAKFLLAFFAP